MSVKVCSGCGVPLQSNFPEQPGFVPESALTKDDVVCRRCFRITHYGEFSRVAVPIEEYQGQVATIRHHPGTVLYVLDVFDLSGSLVDSLHRFIVGSKVILVVNKVDLLPLEVNYNHLTRWIETTVRKTGIEPKETVFVSAKSDIGIDVLIDAVSREDADTVYVVGMANVGKSSILNRWLQRQRGSYTPVFTVSKIPGTTLGMAGMAVKLPEAGEVRIVDTPGLIEEDNLTHHLCPDCLQVVVPSQRLRPRVYQLSPGQTLFFGNAARLDFREGDRQGIVCYVSNELAIHRTKLEHADDFAALHRDDILAVPCADCRQELPWNAGVSIVTSAKLARSSRGTQAQFEIPRAGADVVLPGLGWIALSGKPLAATLWLPEMLQLQLRPRLIGSLSHSGISGEPGRRLLARGDVR